MNNREKATLIWLAIALAAGLSNREIRGSLREVIKAFMAPKVIGPVLALAAWTVALSALAHTVGLWETDVRNDTVLWFITVGLALFFSLERASEGRFFRGTARQAVALTVFVEGFMNLEVLPLRSEPHYPLDRPHGRAMHSDLEAVRRALQALAGARRDGVRYAWWKGTAGAAGRRPARPGAGGPGDPRPARPFGPDRPDHGASRPHRRVRRQR